MNHSYVTDTKREEAQATFEALMYEYGVIYPEGEQLVKIFDYFATKDPRREAFFKAVKRCFNKRKYRKAGVYDFMKTRKYHSMWDKHYNEVITLRFNDYTVTFTRVHTYQNTYGRKYRESDYLEINPK